MNDDKVAGSEGRGDDIYHEVRSCLTVVSHYLYIKLLDIKHMKVAACVKHGNTHLLSSVDVWNETTMF